MKHGMIGKQPVLARSVGEVPLVVDLDGTLTRSDLLIESFFRLFALDPLSLFKVLPWLAQGKAVCKARIADRATLEWHTLPLNQELLSFIRSERSRGRHVYLASASDRRYVAALADHLGLFDGVFASDGATNLSGAEKARVLCEAFGEKGFDYAANADVDLPVWKAARRAILVDVPQRLRRKIDMICSQVHEVSAPRSRTAWWVGYARAMRVHQWLKNALVFLPVLASHSLDAATLGSAGLAFVSFCLCASSVYLLNDLLDLPNDRQHPTKRHRPFASGAIPLAHGLVLIPLLLLGAGLTAMNLPLGFLGVLATYYCITLGYSLVLKRKIVVDVLTLGGLYTTRVIAGAVATGIALSQWLLVFSMFLFLSLALIKRYGELLERSRSQRGQQLAGRGYRTGDAPIVATLAGASGYLSVLVLALYINSADVHEMYRYPDVLWAVALLLLYWISRALMLAHRGEMHDDPVVFAVRDRVSQVTVGLAWLVVLIGWAP